MLHQWAYEKYIKYASIRGFRKILRTFQQYGRYVHI